MRLPLAVISTSLITVLAIQPSAPRPIAAPLRNLTWGQLNFLHTTDTHGWLAGHLHEASYSADWGDYVSFATRMREKAEAQGWDLLVIDTGDRVEGNGLYDSSDPKGVYISEILRRQHIDLISSGNHELYKQNTSEAEFLTTVPNFSGHYLASNINIYHPITKELVPLAPRYKKFTTKHQGIRVVAFGFLFDFTGNYKNTVVEPVEETITEHWFQEVIQDPDVDLFLVIGHVPVHSKEYNAIFRAIRAIHKNTPIQFFGGHHHIRDCARYDSNSYGLASGRFMETIGFMSIDGLSTKDKQISSGQTSLTFNRRYIDNNLFSFYHHTGLDDNTFPTERGLEVSQLIRHSRSALQLDQVYGCVPRTLWMSQARYTSEESIYTWLEKRVLPDLLRDDSRSGRPALAIVNTGAIRFDLFKGPFTRDTAYIVSPFTSGFRYIKDIPHDKAKLIVEVLNKQPQILMSSQETFSRTLAPPEQAAYHHDIDAAGVSQNGNVPLDMPNKQVPMVGNDYPYGQVVPGYTTIDDQGDDGDDTIHSTISFYRVPNCIDTLVSSIAPTIPEVVDLVYIDFIEPHVSLAAQFVGLDVDFDRESDVYMESTTLTDLIVDWVKDNWGCEI